MREQEAQEWAAPSIVRWATVLQAKEEHKHGKLRELGTRAQTAATKDLAVATWRKTEFLQEQNMLMFFTIPVVQITNSRAKEYLRLRREEFGNFRGRLNEEALVEEARQKEMERNSSRR